MAAMRGGCQGGNDAVDGHAFLPAGAGSVPVGEGRSGPWTTLGRDGLRRYPQRPRRHPALRESTGTAIPGPTTGRAWGSASAPPPGSPGAVPPTPSPVPAAARPEFPLPIPTRPTFPGRVVVLRRDGKPLDPKAEHPWPTCRRTSVTARRTLGLPPWGGPHSPGVAAIALMEDGEVRMWGSQRDRADISEIYG